MRFVTAVTRGFFPARHDRGFAAQFSPQTTGKKKTLGPRVAKCALDLQKIEMFSKKATEL